MRSGQGPSAPRGTPDPATLGMVLRRLAVLLGAGVAPASAWSHAGEGTALEAWCRSIGGAAPDALADRVADGAGPLAAERAGLAAMWAVSVAAGAPLAVSLRSYAELVRGFAAAERQSRVALSGPRATARLVLVLPLIGLVLGAVLGQDTIGVLLGTPIGWACLGIGSVLLLGAWTWNRRLLSRAVALERRPGLLPELVAIAMEGGFAASRARDLVSIVAERYGIMADFATVDAAVRIATTAGAPVAELLRAEAEEARRDALASASERAERLGVLLMLPLGICVLPAFLALGVLPMLIALFLSTVEMV